MLIDFIEEEAPGAIDFVPEETAEEKRRGYEFEKTEAGIAQQQAKAAEFLANLGGGAATAIVQAASKVDPTGFFQNMMARQGIPQSQLVPPEAIRGDIEIASQFAREGLGHLGIPPTYIPSSITEPVKEFAAENIASLPEIAPALTAGIVQPRPVARLFQAQMAAALPQSVQALAEAETPSEQVKAGLGVAANVAFPVAIELGLRKALKEKGISDATEERNIAESVSGERAGDDTLRTSTEAGSGGGVQPAAPIAEAQAVTPPRTAPEQGGLLLSDVKFVESIPATENGGRIAIILPDGTAVVGGRIHADTWNKAIELGAATDAQLSDGVAGFVKPDGTAWGVNGKSLPKVSKVIVVGTEVPKPPALPTQRPPAPKPAFTELTPGQKLAEQRALDEALGQQPTPPPKETPTVSRPTKLKPGFIRLWRGGTEGKEGLWFSDSKEVAQFHYENHAYDQNATLSYVDIPKDKSLEYQEAAFAHPDVKSGKTIAEGGDHVLPPEIASQARVVGRKKAQTPKPTPQAEPTPTAVPPAEPSIPTPAQGSQLEPISKTTTPEQGTQALVTPQGPGMVGMGGAAAGEVGTGGGADIYGVAQRVREERAKAGQVAPVEPGKGINAPDSVERGRQLIEQGANAEQTLGAFEKTQKISSDDMAIVRAHGELLAFEARRLEEKFGTESPQYQEAKQRLSDWDKRTKPMQTEWHKIGMAQQGETDIDTGTFTGLERAYRQNTGKDFNPNQKQKAKQIAADVTAANKDAQTKEQRVAFVLRERGGSSAEQRAFDAAKKTVRDWAAKRAELEAKSLAEQQKLKTQMEQVSRKADEDAAKAVTEWHRQAAIRAAKAERAKLAKAGAKSKAKYDAEIKAAQRALDAAAKTVRDAAARAAETERKNLADPIGAVWRKAKEYVDQGVTNFDEVRNKVATDLGMKVEQVTRLMARDTKVKTAADDFWIAQQRARRLHGQAKRWVRAQENPLYERALSGVPRILFSIRVGFHGTVALGTHAPAVAFEPRFWSIYARDFGKMYKMVNPKGGRAYYENQVQDLLRRQNYTAAKRAGLVNDPFTYEDFNSPQTSKFFGDLSGMGNRGYTILKILRQDMFDQMWNGLPKGKQIPEVAQAIANGVNHATGVVKTSAPMGANVALFAPRLEASRVMWLAGDPIRAARTFMDWKNASVGEKEFAINQAKEKAWVIGTMASMLALNQGVLKAIGSNQNVNVTDPTRSDFLKFKVAGMNVSYGNAMITMARLPIRLWVGIRNESKLNKVIYEDENTAKTLFDYARNQASPFASLMMDLAFGRDYSERPLPRAGFGALPQRSMPKRLKAQGVKPYTWTEFWTQQSLPIPFQEAVREVWKAMGMKQADMAHWMKAWAVLTFMSGTGGRISEDYNAPAY